MRFIFLLTLIVVGLSSLSQLPDLILPIGHTSNIQSLAISPDSRFAATSASDKTVRLWDLRTGKLVQLLAGKIKDIHFVYFDSTSQKVFACSKDGKIKAWNIYTGKEILSINGNHLEVAMMKLSYNEKYIISAGIDGSVKIWDSQNGSLLVEVNFPGTMVTGAGFISGDDKFFTVSMDLVLRIWDRSSGKLLNEAEGLRSFAFPVICSFDGKYIAIAEKTVGVKIWDLVQNKWAATIDYAPESLNTMQFIHSGRLLATGASDNTVRIWDPTNGQELNRFSNADEEEINSLALSHDGQMLAAGGSSHIYIWNLHDSKLLHRLEGHRQDIKSMFFYPDDKQLISSSWDKTSRIWNISDGICRMVLKGHTSDYRGIFFDRNFNFLVCGQGLFANDKAWDPSMLQFKDLANSYVLNKDCISPDGKWYVSGNEVRLFPTGQLVKKFSIRTDDATAKSLFSADGKWLVLGEEGEDNDPHRLQIYKTGSWNLIRTINLKSATGFILASPDSKYIFTSEYGESFSCWELASGKQLFKLPYSIVIPEMVTFHPAGKTFALSSEDNKVEIFELPGGKLLKTLNGFTRSPSYVEYSSNGELFLSSGIGEQSTNVWNCNSWQPLYQLGHVVDEDSAVLDARFSPSGRYLFLSLANGNGEIRSASTGELLKVLRGHVGSVYTMISDSEEKTCYTLSADNTIRSWNINSGKPIAVFFTVDSLEYFAKVEDGHYQASTTTARLLHYVDRKLNLINFQQLDVRYNRPDKVLEAIGNTDTSLIKSYRKAWEKRIKKLGIDTTAFRDGYSVPEADFTNRDAIEYEQKSGTLKLLIKGNDSTYKLDRFNVWVNETPIFGQRGISIRKRNKNDFDTTITVQLSQGENRIETSITNLNGTESYRMPLTVNYSPAVKQKESVRFIGIGIDQFTENTYNLQYSAKDIRDLSKTLKEKYKDNIFIDTLFNENVKLLQTTVNDKVIVAYSGHGLLSKEFDYYLSTYAVNFEKPEQYGLPYDELENLLDSIPARKKLMLIDACHSGEVDKEDLITLTASSDSLIKGFKPIVYKKDKKHLGLKNSFELMQSLFVNVGKSTGATIISAAAGTQFALERNDLKNGVFTYSILEAMSKYPTLKISELKKIVGERVEQLTKGLQKPTSRNETIAVDWSL